MWTLEEVKSQLHRLGFWARWWGRGEVAELPRILNDNEQILDVTGGICETGYAIMLLTDYRLIFVDKSFFHCRFDEVMLNMVGSVEYDTGMLAGKLQVTYRGGDLHLRAVPNARLRRFSALLEAKIQPNELEMRV